jgi:hypothetical protein
MKIGSGVKQKAGGDAQDQAADKQKWTIVGHEVQKGFHTVPFLVSAQVPLAETCPRGSQLHHAIENKSSALDLGSTLDKATS